MGCWTLGLERKVDILKNSRHTSAPLVWVMYILSGGFIAEFVLCWRVEYRTVLLPSFDTVAVFLQIL
jgi:hypothetical protein